MLICFMPVHHTRNNVPYYSQVIDSKNNILWFKVVARTNFLNEYYDEDHKLEWNLKQVPYIPWAT